jgi:hypothetical protein
MGAFDDAVTTAMEVWFVDDMDPETVVYDGVPIQAHVDYGENREDQGFRDRDGSAVSATLLVRVEDVAAPARRDAVVINTVTWYVVRVISGDGYTWQLLIERDVRPTFGGV